MGHGIVTTPKEWVVQVYFPFSLMGTTYKEEMNISVSVPESTTCLHSSAAQTRFPAQKKYGNKLRIKCP